MKTPHFVILVIAVAMAGCAALTAAPTATPVPPTPTSLPAPSPTEPPASPAEVVTRAAERFSAGDLEGGMANWADDAIWYIFGLPPNGSEILRGKEAIRAEFENEIAAHLTWEIEPKSVVGNVVTSHDTTWLDFTRQIGVAPVQATGQYLIDDGKIATYAWTIDPESLVKLKAALAEMAAEQPEAAATAPAPTPVSAVTVTIADGTCSYEGPLALQAGEVQVTLDVQDQNRDHYALFFLTLDPDKDFLDLMAVYPSPGVASWANLLPYHEVGPGESLTYSITATEGPLYGICASKYPDHPIGNLGPFEVSQ